MSKKIDLSFLKHKELPTKEITVKINGEDQTFEIKPISGKGLTSFGLINDTDIDRTGKMCLLALIYGLEISQEEAESFINSELFAADTIAAKIIEFTFDYFNEVENAKKNAKKNSKEK